MSGSSLYKNGILEGLRARGKGTPELFFYESADSTNLRAREWARGGGGDAVFVAASQTAGRGRLGRSFLSADGGIYVSFLVHPTEGLSSPSGITAEAAVKLCRAIERVTGISADIKWVNDLYINGKKVAGILTEGEFDENGFLRYYVVGMGINVYKIKDFDRVMPIATTLEDNAKCDININDLCAEIITELLSYTDPRELLDGYRERCFVVGREVTVLRGEKEYSARALSVTDDYSLEILTESGERELLGSGEISLRL